MQRETIEQTFKVLELIKISHKVLKNQTISLISIINNIGINYKFLISEQRRLIKSTNYTN